MPEDPATARPATPGPWDRHLPAGQPWAPGDLVAGGSLPACWAARWAARPSAPVWHFPGASPGAGEWWTAGALDERDPVGRRPPGRGRPRPRRPPALVGRPVAGRRRGLPGGPAPGSGGGAGQPGLHRARGGPRGGRRPPGAGRGRQPPDRPLGGRRRRRGGGGAHSRGARGSRARRRPEGLVLDAAGPSDPALVAYTSGTTGAPKGAVLSHANLLAGVNALLLAWRWEPDDRLVLALPLFHGHGLVAGLFGTLAAGASAVVLERFERGRGARRRGGPAGDPVLRGAHHVPPPGGLARAWTSWRPSGCASRAPHPFRPPCGTASSGRPGCRSSSATA